MTHIVRRQFLHVEVNGAEADGLTIHRQLPDWCEHWLKPAVEQALERCAPTEEHLAVDHLELDVGYFSLERWETELPQAVTRALEQRLRNELVVTSRRTEAETQARRLSPGNFIEEALAHFLRTGRLPWSWRSPDGSSLEEQILQSWNEQSDGLPPCDTRRRFGPLLARMSVRHRLWAQFSAQFRSTFLRRISSAAWEILSQVLNSLPLPSLGVPGQDEFERALWDFLLSKLAGNELPTATELVEHAWRAEKGAGRNFDQLRTLLSGFWAPPLERAERGHASGETAVNRARSGKRETLEPTTEGELEEDGIFIGNAGLVLLHPFLPQLFGALGMAKENRLLQPERALGLLHFLATGQPLAPEHELVLPKVLCEWPCDSAQDGPLDRPVPRPIPLTEVEMNEAMALLETVVRHWSALGNTSPDGLRGSFLLRPGKLSRQDDGDWLLRVESRGFDILLDQLPWGISLIRLPWMNRLLAVEWPSGR